ncbi:MAG: alpha/beta hydrolase [Alcaligenaceae bacterium]
MPLDPTIAQLFAKMSAAGRPALSAGSPQDARDMTAATRAALGTGPDIYQVKDIKIPTRAGSIAGRVFVPAAQVSGLIVYLHGGGWVIGTIDDFDAMARALAARSQCAVLLVDYRLAPEHPFPAGINDSEDAIVWAAAHLKELVGATVPLLVGGDSAGGNLAAVATHSLLGRVAIKGQLLIYPVTGHDFNTQSYQHYSAGMQLTKRDMEWFFENYAPASMHGDPKISPMAQQNVEGLPRTVVLTSEYDVLRDDGELYAKKLISAGVSVVTRRMAGLPHGFVRLYNIVDAADQAMTTIAQDVKTLLQ